MEKKIMKASGLALAAYCAGLAATILTGEAGVMISLWALLLFGLYCAACGFAQLGRDSVGENEPRQQAGAYCYICSPYRGGFFRRIRNRRYARELTRAAIRMGYVPITPHLYLTQVLDDRRQQERERGLALGLRLLDICDIVLVGERYGVSAGMRAEMEKAAKNGAYIKNMR